MNRLISKARSAASAPTRAGASPVGMAAAAGALIAGAAVANFLLAKRAERRHPPQGRFVDVQGVRVHYLEKGTGPVVVLIHGNGVSSGQDFALSGLIDGLARTHRVISFDRPGFGYTERPRGRSWTAKDQAGLILDAMAALSVEQAVVVAHSWGTLVAIEATLNQPDRVQGLVLMSGYYFPTPRVDVPLLSAPAVPVLGDLLRYTISPVLGWAMTPLAIKQIFSPSKVPTHFKEGFPASMSLRPSQLRATAADTGMMPLEALKTSGRHAEITAPVLVIAGDGDKIVSTSHQSRRLARELLAGQIHIVPGAGHMVHHIAPAEVTGAIGEFLEQIGAGTNAQVAA